MKKIMIFITVSVLFVLSCKKKDDTSCSINMANLSGTYKLESVKYKSSSSAIEIDYTTIFFPDACDRDDFYAFQPDGKYQYQDAGITCTPAGDDSGTWTVSGKTMYLDSFPFEIRSFDCRELVFKIDSYLLLGDQLRIIYQKQ